MAHVPEVAHHLPGPPPPRTEPGTLEGRVVLVTGATGFVGRHVVRGLSSRGVDVVAVSRHRASNPEVGAPGVRSVTGDLSDPEFVSELIDTTHPAIVIHLAAVTRPGRVDDGIGGFGDTLRATSRVVDTLIERSPGTRLLLLSSSAVYGRPVSLPVDERAEVRPVTPYGVSKAAQELVALRALWAGALQVEILRAFNLVGPGMPSNLLLGSVVKQLAERTEDGRAVVEVGSLEPRRDYLDVRDAAEALIEVAGSPDPPTLANIATGRSWSVAEVIEMMVALAGGEVQIRPSEERRRAVDIPEQVGDASLLRDTVGWVPRFDIDQSLNDMLEAGTWPRDEGSTCN